MGGRSASTGWSPAATGRSTRSGSRRATASGRATSRPTRRPYEAGSRLRGRASTRRAGSSAARRSSRRGRRGRGSGCAAWSSTIRARSALGNEPVRIDGAIVGRVTQRRLRLRRRALDRLRLPAAGPGRDRDARRGRGVRPVDRLRGGRRAALRPDRREDPIVTDDRSPAAGRRGGRAGRPVRRARAGCRRPAWSAAGRGRRRRARGLAGVRPGGLRRGRRDRAAALPARPRDHDQARPLVRDPADRAIERLIRERIRARFPDHGLVGEEYGRRPARARSRWYIDPIDGTHNYIRGVPLFGTLLALEVDGELQVGVLSAPALRERWYAPGGAGARGRWAPPACRDRGAIHVSRVAGAGRRAGPLRLGRRDRGVRAGARLPGPPRGGLARARVRRLLGLCAGRRGGGRGDGRGRPVRRGTSLRRSSASRRPAAGSPTSPGGAASTAARSSPRTGCSTTRCSPRSAADAAPSARSTQTRPRGRGRTSRSRHRADAGCSWVATSQQSLDQGDSRHASVRAPAGAQRHPVRTLAGSAASVSAATPSPVVGHVYVNNNSAVHNGVAGFDRHADGSLAPMSGSPYPDRWRGTGSPTGSAGAIQFSSDGGTSSPSTRPATTSRSSGSSDDGSLRLVDTERLARHDAGQHRRPSGPRLRRKHRRRWEQLHRLPATIGGHLWSISQGSTVALPDTALPGQVLFSGDGRTRWPGRGSARAPARPIIDSFRVGVDRPPDRGSRLALPGPADRSVRERVPANEPEPAVRLERPRRRTARAACRPTTSGSDATLSADRRLSVRRQPDRAMLGRDQPRRPLPLRHQHGEQLDFALLGSPRSGSLTLLGSTPFNEPDRSPSVRRSALSRRPVTCTSSTPVRRRSVSSRSAAETSPSCRPRRS